MASNQEIFNSIRATLSGSFQERIPEMDAKNMKDIGAMITSSNFTTEFNEWLNEAVNRIGLVLIRETNIRNRLSRFVYGTMEFGDAIEELAVNLIKGEDYQAGTEGNSIDPFRISNPDVQAIYHKVNSRRKYRITTYPDRAKKAFLAEGGLMRLINQIVKQLFDAGELDDWYCTKEIFNSYINTPAAGSINQPYVLTVTEPTNEATGREFVLAVKNAVTEMTYPTGKFNLMNLTKMVDPSNLTIFIRANLLNNIDVNVLSSAFNRTDLNFTPNDSNGFMNMIAMDDFGGLANSEAANLPTYDKYGKMVGYSSAGGTLTDNTTLQVAPIELTDPNANVLAIIAENQFPLITRQLERSESIWNPEGLYWNNFLHRWSQYGYSGFMNAIIIKKS